MTLHLHTWTQSHLYTAIQGSGGWGQVRVSGVRCRQCHRPGLCTCIHGHNHTFTQLYRGERGGGAQVRLSGVRCRQCHRPGLCTCIHGHNHTFTQLYRGEGGGGGGNRWECVAWGVNNVTVQDSTPAYMDTITPLHSYTGERGVGNRWEWVAWGVDNEGALGGLKVRQVIGTVDVPPHSLGGLFMAAPGQIDTITPLHSYTVCVLWGGGGGGWQVRLSGMSCRLSGSTGRTRSGPGIGGLPHCLGLDCPWLCTCVNW